MNTLLSYPDVPFNFKRGVPPGYGEEIVSPNYRLSDRVIYPKELQLINSVRARLRAGRKVGIYATYTGELATFQRIYMLTNKPLEERKIGDWKSELRVEGKKPQTKTKRIYKVSEGKIAFNF